MIVKIKKIKIKIILILKIINKYIIKILSYKDLKIG
jgi:hypothetical protein